MPDIVHGGNVPPDGSFWENGTSDLHELFKKHIANEPGIVLFTVKITTGASAKN